MVTKQETKSTEDKPNTDYLSKLGNIGNIGTPVVLGVLLTFFTNMHKDFQDNLTAGRAEYTTLLREQREYDSKRFEEVSKKNQTILELVQKNQMVMEQQIKATGDQQKQLTEILIELKKIKGTED